MSTVDDDTSLQDLITLSLVAGVGPRTCRELLAQFGDASKVLDAPFSRLRDVQGVGPKIAERITQARAAGLGKTELEDCRRLGVEVVVRGSSTYSGQLEEIPDPPSLLYVRGKLEPRDHLAIAIVGSRKCTPYGLRMAERLATALARTGFTVISGLARGIDAAAHRGALKGGGRTIGVLANGLAQIYPPEHEELADEVTRSGALISEMPLFQQPISGLFPQRNRIISGMSLGVLVIEATPRSGSLSTASHAVEQNREVFAVPGPADSLASRGCHRLIRDGARLVETVDDILEELGPLVREVRTTPDEPPVRHPAELALGDGERSLLGHLGDSPIGVDELIGKTRMTASQVMATLSVLEMKRLVRRMPGHMFVRA